MEAYSELIAEGKIRVIGASNFTPERLRDALEASEHSLPKYQSLQPHYNLVERENFETNLETVCREYNIGVIPYYSLASGFLTGKYRSEADLGKSPRGEGVKKYLNEKGFAVLAELDKVASIYQATPAQVALAWLISRPVVTSAIVSATSVSQLNDISKSAALKIDAEHLSMLSSTRL